MNIRIACGLAVCLGGFLLAGCSANPGIVRGQSPDQTQPAGRATVEQVGFNGDHLLFHGGHPLVDDNHRLFTGEHRLFNSDHRLHDGMNRLLNSDHQVREDPGACQGPNCQYLHGDSQHGDGQHGDGQHGDGHQFGSGGHEHYGAGGSCPSCQNGYDDGQTWHPTHRHWFKYQQPRNLVYPPANAPAAMVQYPYYNVKGPSDFFMK